MLTSRVLQNVPRFTREPRLPRGQGGVQIHAGRQVTILPFPRKLAVSYPPTSSARTEFVLERRGPKNHLDSNRAYGAFVEEEPDESGALVGVATVLLTNRECPWRCVFCDLWKDTLDATVPPGAIDTQIRGALAGLPPGRAPRWIKLYNAGSFFDPHAIPTADHPAIAERLRSFEQVIVECHPALVNERVLKFRDLLAGKLEVAMGLETAHPEVLEKLNKRMTLDQFRRAAEYLRENDIALRVFVLVKPPFLDESEALHWAKRSVDFAFDCGATVVSLIPTRLGNGALETLAARGEFSPPKLATLEAALDYGIGWKRARVFADLWDLESFADCEECFEPRRSRLHEMNLRQVIRPRVACECCGERTR